jgi:hypothetical protein
MAWVSPSRFACGSKPVPALGNEVWHVLRRRPRCNPGLVNNGLIGIAHEANQRDERVPYLVIVIAVFGSIAAIPILTVKPMHPALVATGCCANAPRNFCATLFAQWTLVSGNTMMNSSAAIRAIQLPLLSGNLDTSGNLAAASRNELRPLRQARHSVRSQSQSESVPIDCALPASP